MTTLPNHRARCVSLAGVLLLNLNIAHGQTPPNAATPTPASIPYATMQVIADGDSDAVIAEKAAKVLPRPNQTAWMRLERTFFLHFGVNTFNEVEWGSGREEPSIFNPTELDANQWLDAMKNFGGKMIVLVCKHHDGFCLWPTRYTPHSVVGQSVARRQGRSGARGGRCRAGARHQTGRLSFAGGPLPVEDESEESGGLLRQRQQQCALGHSDRSGQLPEQSRQGPHAGAGFHELHLRGGRLQSLLPEPALRVADGIRADRGSLVRRRES